MYKDVPKLEEENHWTPIYRYSDTPMFCWGSQTPKQTLVCIWPALLPIVSARSIAVILSEDFRRLNLSHCCDVFGLVADRGRKRTEPCRWSTLRPRTNQWSQYDSIWMRTAKCLQGMTTATSKKESSCFPPCEGYESSNADLSSTANQGVIAGANTTNIGFTPLPHIKWQCNWPGLRLWSWSFWSKRIFRSTKRIPWPQQRVAPAGRRNTKAATSRVTPSNVVRKLGFSNSWFCRSFQLLREEDNWQHSFDKFWGRTCDFSKSTRLWTRLTLVQFFLSREVQGPCNQEANSKIGKCRTWSNQPTSLVCNQPWCNSWHSKVQKFYGLMARRNTEILVQTTSSCASQAGASKFAPPMWHGSDPTH